MSTVYTYADWLIREGCEDEFVQIWTEFVDSSAGETDAALGGLLLQDSADRQRFISIGPWRSADEAYQWFRRPDLEERSMRLREVAERFEPRFLELKVRRGELG